MTDSPAYQVLARKWRPASFADLIGQAAMVRTLENAFTADRIAQAFMLTGIRGTGKTTTARIIAKGLNCLAAEGPTTTPCGACGPCRAIAESRHVDVLEYDSASNSKVDQMREILAGVPYRPTETRFKVYIFDEVHMLSGAAFNALLKTLEEPPAHVKFVFATTEIRKVPVTILSRCQRFDLRRVEPEEMIAHLARVAAAEGAEAEAEALALIARAAEGSVRDAVSLLDQAIGHGTGRIDAGAVRAMLGLADRGRVLDLFERIMKGDAAGALGELAAQYADGADPAAVLRELAEATHWLSIVKITPEAADDPAVAPEERDRGRDLSARLPMRVLTRAWQMLLKALDEVARAPNAMMAAEMAVIRLTHVATLPAPEELVRRLESGPPPSPPPAPGPGAGHGNGRPTTGGEGRAPASRATGAQAGGAATARALAPAAQLAAWPRFETVLELIREHRDLDLLLAVEEHLRLVSYAPGRIEFTPTDEAPGDLAHRLQRRLGQWTGARWTVTVASGGTAPTIAEARAAERADAERAARAHPLVRAVFDAFPEARIADIRPPEAAEADAAGAALPPAPEADDDADDFDPFEEE